MAELKLATTKPPVPDFSWKRNRRRAEKAVLWVLLNFPDGAPRPLHDRMLQQGLGQQQHRLSGWVRRTLLLKHAGYQPGVMPKHHELREDGLKYLLDLLGLTEEEVVFRIDDLYAQELVTGEFLYDEKYEGAWHQLHKMRHKHVAAFWDRNGYTHRYSLVHPLPNILYQAALKAGVRRANLLPLYDFIHHRKEWLGHIRNLTETTWAEVEKVAFLLLRTAHLSASRTTVYQRLGEQRHLMRALRTDEKVTVLRDAIQLAWGAIARHLPKGERKWYLYVAEERKVLEVARAFCQEQGVRVFTQHNEWRTDQPIDHKKLQARIKKETGYKLRVKRQLS